MSKPTTPPGQGGGPPGQGGVKPVTVVATLHEARDICDLAATYPITAAIGALEAADACAIAGKPTGKAVLALAESADRCQILATSFLFTSATITGVEGRDVAAVAGVTPTPTPPSNWASRITAPGVFMYRKMDQPSDLGIPVAQGAADLGYTPTTYYGYHAPGLAGLVAPQIDTTRGALKLTFASGPNAGADAAGAWYTRFSFDDSITFNANSEFYVQFGYTQSGWLTDPAVPEGVKINFLSGNASTGSGSTSQDQGLIVHQAYSQLAAPFLYAYYPLTPPHDPTSDHYTLPSGGTDYFLPYIQIGVPYNYATAYKIPANEHIFFQLHVKLLDRRPAPLDEYVDAVIEGWVTKGDGTTIKIYQMDQSVPIYTPIHVHPVQPYGKLAFLPYTTGTNPANLHPTYYFWYDQLIMSTQRIPDPSSAGPTWRQGLTQGSFHEIANTQLGGVFNGTNSAVDEPNQVTYAWQGFAAGDTTLYTAAASGHDHFVNPVAGINLNVDAPAWQLIDGGSASASANYNQFYADGRLSSRHTYYSQHFVDAAHDINGHDRIMLLGAQGTYYQGAPGGGYRGGPEVNSFDLTAGQWDGANKWPNMPAAQTPNFGANYGLCAQAQHPTTKDIYVAGGTTWWKWTAATGITSVVLNSAFSGELSEGPSCIDTLQGRFAVLIGPSSYNFGYVAQIIYLDLVGNTEHQLIVTGDLSTDIASGLVSYVDSAMVYDADNNRYLAFLIRFDVFNSPIRIYSINPSTGASTFLTTGPSAWQNDSTGLGMFSRISYMQSLGGVAYLPKYTDNFWFFPTR